MAPFSPCIVTKPVYMNMSVSFRMLRVQYRALTCLHSVLSAMDAESLGGAPALQDAAQHLSTLVFGVEGSPFLSLRSKEDCTYHDYSMIRFYLPSDPL